MNAPVRPSAQASHLDAIRGAAALLVVLQHARQLFVTSDLNGHLSASGFFFWLSGRGGAAVNVFFVLSGFLIASSIRSSVERDRWSWARYADARLTRLLVPLVPALLLTAFWDRLGLHLFGPGAYPYNNPQYLVLNGSATDSLGIATFLGNLAFLQLMFVPLFGTNGTLWSLAPEFWYYVMFPMMYLSVKAKGLEPTWRVVLFFAAIALLPFVWHETLIRFPLWLFGAAVAFLPRREWGASLPFRAVALLAFFAMETSGWLWPQVYFRLLDLGSSLAFAAFVWGLLCTEPKNSSTLYAKVSEAMAGISYTLYLVHFPLLVFLAARFFPTGPQWALTPLTALYVVGLVALMVAYGILLWLPFERNTKRIREWILPGLKRAKLS